MGGLIGALMVAVLAAQAGGIPAVSGAVQVHSPAAVVKGEVPTVTLIAPARDAVFYLECPRERQAPYTFTSSLTPAGQPARVPLPVRAPENQITCVLLASFANGLAERREVSAQWEWIDPPPPTPPASPAPAPQR